MGSSFKKLKHDLYGRHETKHKLEEVEILYFFHSVSGRYIRKSSKHEARQIRV